MFRLKNISGKVIYLYVSHTLNMIEVYPNDIIEVYDLEEYINLEGVLDPSKNIMRIL